ncbi:hypothetical protein, partial [Shouchella clausii]|uniref:hypothetical protein n=1 Tax=Shouchella clausii TaxID=79880 RepID=UPI0038622E78
KRQFILFQTIVPKNQYFLERRGVEQRAKASCLDAKTSPDKLVEEETVLFQTIAPKNQHF